MFKDLLHIAVEPDTFEVSQDAVLLTAQLCGALALCLHDEGRGIGGLLHLRFCGASGRPNDVSDNSLNSALVVLDRFKRAVLSGASRRGHVQGRILAHALPPADASEPTASLVDLLLADLTDAKITCGTQIKRRADPVQVRFQPFDGRIWISSGESSP